MEKTIHAVAVLLLLLVLALFLGLRARPIEKIQEARVAETAREMLENDDWLIPRMNGEIRLRKPPLAYWSTAIAYEAIGSVDEFSARISSVCFSVLTVLILFFWMRSELGADSAFVGALCLITNYIALRYFRSGESDAILLFFVVAACILVYRLLFSATTLRHVALLHLCMGFGFLAKGPAAVAIPLICSLLFAIKNRRFDILAKCLHPLGVVIFFVTAFGWYVLIYYKFPEQAIFWIRTEVDATFITGSHAQPFYWYVPRIFAFAAPWSVFIIPAAIWLYRTRPHGPVVKYASTWFVATFVLLSLNVNKQMQYALLLSPPLMVLIGAYLAGSKGGYARFNRYALFTLLALAILALPLLVHRLQGWNDIEIWDAALLVGGLSPWLAGKLLDRSKKSNHIPLLLACTVAALWLYGERHRYESREIFDVKNFAVAAREHTPLFIYERDNPAVSFYAQRIVPAVRTHDELQSLLVRHETINLAVKGSAPRWDTGLDATRVMGVGSFTLWKITREHRAAVKYDGKLAHKYY